MALLLTSGGWHELERLKDTDAPQKLLELATASSAAAHYLVSGRYRQGCCSGAVGFLQNR